MNNQEFKNKQVMLKSHDKLRLMIIDNWLIRINCHKLSSIVINQFVTIGDDWWRLYTGCPKKKLSLGI